MNISSAASSSAALAAAQTQGAVANELFKKTLDLQKQNAAQLIAALPQASNPPNLGSLVDVRA